MISKIEPIFKWLCLLLTVVVIMLAAYNWRDSRFDTERIKANNLAVALSQVNNIQQEASVVRQVNNVLVQTGYGSLARPIQTAPPAIEGTVPEQAE